MPPLEERHRDGTDATIYDGCFRGNRRGAAYSRSDFSGDGIAVSILHRQRSGKTTALFHSAQEQGGAYVQIGEAHKNIAGMYLAVLGAFNIHASSTYERELFNQVIRVLSPHWSKPDEPRRLLIVDEFQTFEDRTKRELLKIQETCGFALVLAGNSERIMSSGKKDVKALQQIEDRIGVRVAPHRWMMTIALLSARPMASKEWTPTGQ